ncbi:nucleotidyltransferase domain-containing protein [bacterium]|nr:nucleotidyltransferase domain-containing protein [bacterium]
MAEMFNTNERLLKSLEERAKELSCLLEIEELLAQTDAPMDTIFNGVINAIPSGWHYTDHCFARITCQGRQYIPAGRRPTSRSYKAPIEVNDRTEGYVEVYYDNDLEKRSDSLFHEEEKRLLRTIATRLGEFLSRRQLTEILQDRSGNRLDSFTRSGEWRVVVDMLRVTDEELYVRIARKMMTHLSMNGVREVEEVLHRLGSEDSVDVNGNRPMQRSNTYNIMLVSEEIFRIAEENLQDVDSRALIQQWMQEDRAGFLVRTLINLDTSLNDISEAVRRFHHLSLDSLDLPEWTRQGLKVALVRRFLTDQVEFIDIAKKYVEIKDFITLIRKLIHPVSSRGKVGGKSAGLFLANRILKQMSAEYPELTDVRMPKTWYITSDGLHSFLQHNNLEEITEQKYKGLKQVRIEHPHVIQLFKNSRFPSEIIQGLSMALDDFGDGPLIVRSSSLLEDRLGAAFSGKYTSLFLANQGTKRERLEALMDAIAEVYSSTFGSDPIEYRSERGLIDFHEEMGILIQEVVGTRVGDYFLPSFAGVAFSRNEFRWSPRIKREDGLIRLVPGLGTRAVDRLADDYTILVAPGQPGLRVNVTVDETIRYAPRYMDVINLDTNEFETVEAEAFLKEHGAELPAVERLVSKLEDNRLTHTTLLNLDFEQDDFVVTFEGLVHRGPFIKLMQTILRVLEEKMGVPVDIEYASDGKRFYLLQCRPQSNSMEIESTPIPQDIPENAILFTANKFVSNGKVPDITHVVYVDPIKYSEISSHEDLMTVGRVVGQLNSILPKRQFILMGPGRWGSRGDIKLGVNVTYSDINNTAMLIEIAKQKGNYLPDLSFGTHFFQDLVEASIRYLPLYPDDEESVFNESFLLDTENKLPDMLPEYRHLADVVRVINVPEVMEGKVVRVFMNADVDEAVAIFSQRSGQTTSSGLKKRSHWHKDQEDHWRWRMKMVEAIAEQVDTERFGVKALYLFGSTKNGNVLPDSDVDLLVHVDANSRQKKELQAWFDGWSYAMDEINFARTGHRTGGLLDVHMVTDKDIAKNRDYAERINSPTDPAKQIPLGKHKSGIRHGAAPIGTSDVSE